MQLEPKRALVPVAILAGLGALGAWVDARVTTSARLRDVRVEVRAIGYARGGRLPTNAEVEDEVRAIARAHEVTLSSLEVSSHDEAGLGPIGALVPQLGRTIGGTSRVYAIRASGSTSMLGLSRTEAIEVDLPLRAEAHVLDPRGGAAAPADDALHGRVDPSELDTRYGP